MTWATVAVAGASLVGGYMASSGAQSAADTQANAANQATGLQKQMFDKTVQLEQPYNMAGVGAMNKLSYLLGISPNGYYSQDPNATIGPNGVSSGSAAAGGASAQPAAGGGAGVTLDPDLRDALLGNMGNIAITPNLRNQLQQGLAYGGQISPELATSLRAQIPNLTASPALQTRLTQALANIPTAGAATPGNGGQMVPGGGGPFASGAAGGANDPAYGSLLHNFGLNDFQLDPGIQFQLKYGQQALQNSQAAQNGVLSGGALKDLLSFNQGLAGTGYQSAFDRYMANKSFTLGSLMDLTKLGQAAAGNTVNAAPNFSSGMAGSIMGAGNARAAGDVGSANALSSGITGAGNAYFLRNLLNPNSGASTFTPDVTMPYLTSTGSLGD